MTVATRPSDKTLDALWTWEDLWSLPEDGNLYEIIDGELYVIAPPVSVHQELVTRLVIEFHQAVMPSNLGRLYTAPIGVRLSERDIVQPDILFIAHDRLGIVKKKLIDGAPDIVVEVFSPSTRAKDRNEMAALYARSGVREYWQVDPRHRAVVVLALRDGIYKEVRSEDGIARSSILPDLAVDVAALFADLV